MKASYFDWKNINLSDFREANAFAGLRGSVEYEPNVSLVHEWLSLKIDHKRNLEKMAAGLKPDHRIEFSRNPWPVRFPQGTFERLSYVFMMSATYIPEISTKVSILQGYSRTYNVPGTTGGVIYQLELATEGQGGAKGGEIQMIVNTDIRDGKKYRVPTGIIPGPNEPIPVEVDVLHGLSGHLRIKVKNIVVYDQPAQIGLEIDPEATTQWKIGLYFHELRDNPALNQRYVDARQNVTEMRISPLTLIEREPHEGPIPEDLKALTDPNREIRGFNEVAALKAKIDLIKSLI